MYRDNQYQEAKDRVKISHFTEKGYDITGIMHVGTNYGYEFQWYRKMGIEYFIGFEPLPSAIEEFKKNYPTLTTGKEFFFPFALGDEHNTSHVMNVPKGDGQGASFLKELNPNLDFPFIDPVQAKIRRFDQLVTDTSPLLPIEMFDCLVVDVQGMELDVLMGMGKYLDHFKFLNIECSEKPMFDYGPSGQEIVEYLENRGFQQDSPMEVHNDVFFIKKCL